MPEGDTVYRTAATLSVLTGKSLVRGDLRHPRLSTVDLSGRVVVGVRTVGKHLFVRFDRDLSLRNHLGMDGAWQVYPARGRWRRPAFQARAVLVTAEQQAIGFNLHEMALVPTDEEDRLVAHLGPDLLDPTWGPSHVDEAVARLTAEPEREIGLALLDQRVMAGVGNVYKAEICYLLGVSPWTPVSGVDARLAVELSRKLLDHNKMSVDRNTTGEQAKDRQLWVYGRRRGGCLRCGGRVVAGVQGSDVHERVAYFCPHCQPGPAA
ncbi:DNA-formamidopyrimidine glycosylase family protein [Actinokineospora sp. NBRC 105648]|uniref:DNA-formamidopyrimidine glycosylase family protein n=1 Tax=Actinokineospora sp. NBRC 105648 TaxID=3032206 RepID=UPI0024A43351|nr:DNA-formamidopyrimidine glycosylase family protein [Actinokineospora sp. NBRC 105648]GLZ40168.1 endonuclease VIII [Actinokineospora sp. NBRC 105648]